MTLEDLEVLLKKHDWNYAKADSVRAWHDGGTNQQAIERGIKELGQPAQILYDQYNPEIKSSGGFKYE